MRFINCVGEAGYGVWSNWSPCNNTCAPAYQARNRTCTNKDLGCTAESVQSKLCDVVPCPGQYVTVYIKEYTKV